MIKARALCDPETDPGGSLVLLATATEYFDLRLEGVLDEDPNWVR